MKTTTFLLILSLWAIPTWAENKSTAENNESDKIDIQKLEQKYWSAKDDSFSVVQNRAFSKEKRWYFNLSYGMPLNDPFATGSIVGTNVGYYFSERWGLEFNYKKGNFKENESAQTYREQNGVYPDANRFQSSKMIYGTWVPLYAKMSWLDKKIIYFDMGLQFGIGQTEYQILREDGGQIKNSTAYSINLMQHFFFSEKWAFRVDLTNTWTPEDRMRYYVNGTSGSRSLSSRTINDTSLILGITYWK